MQIIQGSPATSMDDYQLNLTTIIKHAVRNYPEREIVYRTPGGICQYTYHEAYVRMQRLANALETMGVQTGDKVGVLEWNSHRFFELYYSISGIGAVLLQMNLRIGPVEMAYVVNHSEAKIIFVDESLLSLAEMIAPNLHTVKGYVIMTDKDPAVVKTSLGPVYSYEQLLQEAQPQYQWPMIDEKSAFSACYTTGTTGKPKGVYCSHRAMFLHTMTMALYMRASHEDTFMQIVPMFHAQGWGLFFVANFVGAKIVFPGRFMVDNVQPLVDLLVQEKVTRTAGAPAIFMPMLHYIEKMEQKPDLTGACLVSGATEPPLSMIRGWKELTGADVVHDYGATETTPLASYNLLKPNLEVKLSDEEKWDLKRKQGLAVVGLDMRIVDPQGQDLPRDGVSSGEILWRGPWITGSYYNDSRTKESFREGYWESGDAGTVDSEGYLKITDRVKDLIKSGGEWISSVDLENAIMGHPGVLEAAVTGVFHPKWQERPLAFVVLKEGYRGKVKEEDIIDFISSRFIKWQLPDGVIFIDEVPKTSVGKFKKSELREKYNDYLVNKS